MVTTHKPKQVSKSEGPVSYYTQFKLTCLKPVNFQLEAGGAPMGLNIRF